MDKEKLLQKYYRINIFREYTKNECLKTVDLFEKERCNHLVELVDNECKRIEKLLQSPTVT